MDLKPRTTGLRPTPAKCVPECAFQHSCFIFVMCLLAATPARPQTATDGIRLGDVDFTATLRVREYVWNWFEPARSYENQYAYSGNILRLNFAERRGALDWDAEIAVPFLLYMPNAATAPAPQGALGLGAN